MVLELCGEIDVNIEESTSLLYEDDQNQALMHMQIALKKLNVSASKSPKDLSLIYIDSKPAIRKTSLKERSQSLIKAQEIVEQRA